jgi:hypothetical protein
MLHQSSTSTNTTTRREVQRKRTENATYARIVEAAEARQQRINRALEESIKFLGGEIDIIFA